MTDESLSSSEKLFGLGADIVEIQRYRDLDPEAPFFKAADYGVIGDAFEVLPRLTEAVKKFKASN